MKLCLAFWRRSVIHNASYGFYINICSSNVTFLGSFSVSWFELNYNIYLCFQVADTKQKRKKGIFTKQGGDKEVLFD